MCGHQSVFHAKYEFWLGCQRWPIRIELIIGLQSITITMLLLFEPKKRSSEENPDRREAVIGINWIFECFCSVHPSVFHAKYEFWLGSKGWWPIRIKHLIRHLWLVYTYSVTVIWKGGGGLAILINIFTYVSQSVCHAKYELRLRGSGGQSESIILIVLRRWGEGMDILIKTFGGYSVYCF